MAISMAFGSSMATGFSATVVVLNTYALPPMINEAEVVMSMELRWILKAANQAVKPTAMGNAATMVLTCSRLTSAGSSRNADRVFSLSCFIA